MAISEGVPRAIQMQKMLQALEGTPAVASVYRSGENTRLSLQILASRERLRIVSLLS
jgi:hypothetical protein